ncbi:C-5 cytosine-specific DNA methylase [Rhodobacter sp. JA431]|nr:C-5 cytosine-specific DNA methylase [Rhodobacter sp. JA431]
MPGYRAVGHVERETYAAATLVARMEDASLDQAVVWDDVGTFDGRPWRGAVDIVTAGYPCQPFSVAGKWILRNVATLELFSKCLVN